MKYLNWFLILIALQSPLHALAQTPEAEVLSFKQRKSFCDKMTDLSERNLCLQFLTMDLLQVLSRQADEAKLQNEPQKQEEKKPEDFGPHAEFVAQAKQLIAKSFKDPSSIQYRGLFISKSGGFPVLCGEINTKNIYGAYGGYRNFFSSNASSLQDIEDPKRPEIVAYMWARICAEKTHDFSEGK